MYWSTTVDSTVIRLSGTHDYIIHFPAGGLPPNNAFWSLTMEDSKYYMVNNSINRYNFNSFSNLTPNPDGSVDIYLQNMAPSGNESNWLPAPPETSCCGCAPTCLPGDPERFVPGAASRGGELMPDIRHRPWLLFAIVVLVMWGIGTVAYIDYYPQITYSVLGNAGINNGAGANPSGIPVNTLYTLPTFASPSTLAGGNHDTLYTLGALDLGKGPQVLHVPDMAGRYYSVECFDYWGNPSYVGTRTTVIRLVTISSADGWKGNLPAGMKHISFSENRVLVLGRVLVYNDSDLATAYNLSKQIRLTPLA